MKTKKYSIHNPSHIKNAIACLNTGGVIAFPTDTVYGIGAIINNKAALKRIYSIKERNLLKALPVMVSSLNQLPSLIDPESDYIAAHKLASCFWPGALTLIFKKQLKISNLISQTNTIGIRMPDYPPVLDLINQTGPLAVTSANLSGNRNPLSAEEVLEQLDGRIDIILDGGKTTGLQPSTVVNCSDPETINILREGAITEEMLEECLHA